MPVPVPRSAVAHGRRLNAGARLSGALVLALLAITGTAPGAAFGARISSRSSSLAQVNWLPEDVVAYAARRVGCKLSARRSVETTCKARKTVKHSSKWRFVKRHGSARTKRSLRFRKQGHTKHSGTSTKPKPPTLGGLSEALLPPAPLPEGVAPVEKPPVKGPPVEKRPGRTPPVGVPPVKAPPVETPPVETPPVETPPVETPPVETPPVETPPVETTPVETPPVETPPVETPPVEPPAPFRLFAPTSVWNEQLPANAPLDPTSTAVVGAFDQLVAQESPKNQLNINATSWSVPIYTVPASQPTVKVLLKKSSPPLQTALTAVPLPPGAQPAQGTDKHLVVWQPSTDKMWEFWSFENTPTGPAAQWAGAMEKVSTDPGFYNSTAWPRAQNSWGASASSLPIAAGLITLEDLEKGQINHALALAIPNPRAGVYALPAQQTDGRSLEPLSLPEGAHLRLDPNLNLAALHLPHLILMMAEAAQRYGIIVRDTAGNVVFYAQDPTPTGTNPYAGPQGYFEGKFPSKLLQSFPWSHLQLLKMELR
jgi:hypothetical protein